MGSGRQVQSIRPFDVPSDESEVIYSERFASLAGLQGVEGEVDCTGL
jgi:hypothetical protein